MSERRCVYLGPERGSGAGGADRAVAGEGDGQPSGPVLAGLVLTHQPALGHRDAQRTLSVSGFKEGSKQRVGMLRRDEPTRQPNVRVIFIFLFLCF